MRLHAELADECRNSRAARVHPGRRLVEEEHLAVAHQATRQVQPLFHPARVLLDALVRLLDEPDALEGLLRPCAGRPSWELVERAPVLEILAAGEPPVEAAVATEDDADQRPDGARLLDDVVTEDRARPEVGRRTVEEDLDERRLPGAVRTEEAVDLALGDAQRHRRARRRASHRVAAARRRA